MRFVPDEPENQVQLHAPAKLTLDLRVTGVRDDGYHLIDAEMIALDFGDDLLIGSGTSLTMETAADAPPACGDLSAISLDGDNLVARALRLVDRSRSVHLLKRIPPGAGLGGGSADAAAILRWAGWTDLDAAARLGADVAFCLVGGRARVSGIGEVIEPVPHRDLTVTLLTPPFGCNTAAVYGMWDDLGGPVGDHGNDLEPAALRVEPRLASWRDELHELSGSRPRLAGSGSTWFVEGAFDHPECVVARAVPREAPRPEKAL